MSDADRLEAVLATVPDPTDRAWLRRVLEGLAAQCAAPAITASRYPFELRIAGETVIGVLETESELGGRAAVVEPAAPIAMAEPRGPGRPSHAATIAAAVRELGARFDCRLSLAGRARQLLKHIASTGIEAWAIPSQRTVENFLRVGNKLRRNSRRGKRQARRKRCSTN